MLRNFSNNWRLAGSFIYQRQRIKDSTQLELDPTVTERGQTFNPTVAYLPRQKVGRSMYPTIKELGPRQRSMESLFQQRLSGGTGLNLFSDPAAVFGALRPFLLSQDGRSARGSVRGLGFSSLDFSLGKSTVVTERVRIVIAADFFNIFNHPVFADPTLSLLSSPTFGVISNQLTGNPARGDFAGPRRIQFGVRIEF